MDEGNGKIRFGVYACSHEDSSFTAVFSETTDSSRTDKRERLLVTEKMPGGITRWNSR
jgi:hypothetical protein